MLQKLVELGVLVLPEVIEDGSLASDICPELGEEEQSGAAKVEGSESKAFLPTFEPFSPASVGSGVDARLKVRLAQVQVDARERAEDRQAERELLLKIRRLEIEAEIEIKMRELDLKAAKSAPAPVVQPQLAAVAPSEGAALGTNFDVSKNISLVPQFRETEVDSYFGVFERIASALNWSREVWPLLLQCKLTGKVQEVCATLSLEDSLKYDAVKV